MGGSTLTVKRSSKGMMMETLSLQAKLEAQMEAAARRLSGGGDAAEAQYAEAYDGLVKLGVAAPLRRKYRQVA